MPLHVSSTMCSSSGGQKLYYTASGIITPIGCHPVFGFREDSLCLNLNLNLTLSTSARDGHLWV